MTYQEAKSQFDNLFKNSMGFEEAQVLLREMFQRGETADEIAAAAEVMKSHAITLSIDKELESKLVDVVGTGGDKSFSFNISTTTSLLVCAAGGFVAKHGNRSITSKSGSADVLEALGVSLSLVPEQQKKMLEETGFVFMFAQNHHPAMKHIMPIRKSLDHRTIFNILGPLTNPASVKKQFIGVYDRTLAPILAEVLKKMGSDSAAVACGDGGVDELTLSGPSHIARLIGQTTHLYDLDPTHFGLAQAPLEALKGGDAQFNAGITHKIFCNQATDAQRDVVLFNAAMAFEVLGMARDIKEGLDLAADTLYSGRALRKLKQIVDVSAKL
ncbi:MAG: anthranilate phosphoribosyltransferase [Helicobacteraceae bacterium]|jgi:anthranilate phosphoribosyltransferase|nr:anthranilate phosphoribosyltransferase [Helicobacteraceae bacterium]